MPGHEEEIGRLWKLKRVDVVPVVIGALGSITIKFERWIEKLRITCNVRVVQTSALLGSVKIWGHSKSTYSQYSSILGPLPPCTLLYIF